MDLPDSNDRRAVAKFAMSFNAYDHLGDFKSVANVAKSKSRGTLEELRIELFFEFRASNHRGDDKFLKVYEELKPLFEQYANNTLPDAQTGQLRSRDQFLRGGASRKDYPLNLPPSGGEGACNKMKPSDVQKLLSDRSGIPTYVHTVHGEMLYVNDLFWLQDDDEEFPYAITNSNCESESIVSNVFYSNEIVKIVDYKTHEVVYESVRT